MSEDWTMRNEAGWIHLDDIPHGSVLNKPEVLRKIVAILFSEAQYWSIAGQRKLAYQCAIKGYELKSYYI